MNIKKLLPALVITGSLLLTSGLALAQSNTNTTTFDQKVSQQYDKGKAKLNQQLQRGKTEIKKLDNKAKGQCGCKKCGCYKATKASCPAAQK